MIALTKPKGSGETLKFYAFGCVHAPLQDDECIDWHCKNIQEQKPDLIVNLGDGFEADAASRWPSEYGWSLRDEYEVHESILKKIRLAWPSAERKYLLGNHCDNILSINRIDQKLRGLVDFRSEHLCPELHKHWDIAAEYTYSRSRGVYRRGQVTFGHGYDCNQNADEHHSLILGVPFGLYIGAHTHKPLQVTEAKKGQIPLKHWYANAGMSRKFDPDYIRRKRQFAWGQAGVFGELKDIKSPRVNREWSAHTETFRMFNDWDSQTKRK